MSALRIALRVVATRDFVSSDLRDAVEDLLGDLVTELGGAERIGQKNGQTSDRKSPAKKAAAPKSEHPERAAAPPRAGKPPARYLPRHGFHR